MSRKLVSLTTLTIILIGLLGVALEFQMVKAYETIYIRPDGSVEGTTKIQRDGNVYTFIDNINGSIVVERNNIIIDGTEYTLQGTGWGNGIYLSGRNSVTIKNIEIRKFSCGINLYGCSNSTISRNHVTSNSFQGVLLDSSFNNILSENHITNNGWRGVKLLHSSNNTFFGNDIENNTNQGVQLHLTSNNTFSGNMMNDNKYNFDVWGHELDHFMHSIDVSNFVDGKPLHYLVNQKDLGISPATHQQIGYLALINCTNITVEGLNLTNNGQGLLFAYTNNSRIIDNNITNNDFGVWFESSFGNNVCGNNMRNNDYGVWLGSSSNNVLCRNNITDNHYGVWPYLSFDNILSGNNIRSNSYGVWFDSSFDNALSGNNIERNLFGVWFCGSSNNSLSGNNIENNTNGIRLGFDPSFGNVFVGNNISKNDVGAKLLSSSNNEFYHNNFIDNSVQACNYPSDCSNLWDDCGEGNYWSDYEGADINHDGIGDSGYEITENNADHHPLMGMFHSFNNTLGHHVNVISNSTIEDFQYFEFNRTIKMHVLNMTGDQIYGFCRICIPHALINAGDISVIIDDGLTPVLHQNYDLNDNGTHRWIYFGYQHSTHEIEVVPEFSSFLISLLFMMATLLAVIACKRKH